MTIRPQSDDWDGLGIISQRMIMAWDRVDEEDEARSLVTYSTERQRALIWRFLWQDGTEKWRKWAIEWLVKDASK